MLRQTKTELEKNSSDSFGNHSRTAHQNRKSISRKIAHADKSFRKSQNFPVVHQDYWL